MDAAKVACYYRCYICKSKFATRNILHQHQISQHFDLAVACPTCNKRFINLMVLGEHVAAHSIKCHSCCICGNLCADGLDLAIHLSTSHKDERTITCELCSIMFVRRRQLIEHIKSTHREEFSSITRIVESFCSIHCTQNVPECIVWPQSGIFYFIPRKSDAAVNNGAAESTCLHHPNGGASNSRLPNSNLSEATQAATTSDHGKQVPTIVRSSSHPYAIVNSSQIASRMQAERRLDRGEILLLKKQSEPSTSKQNPPNKLMQILSQQVRENRSQSRLIYIKSRENIQGPRGVASVSGQNNTKGVKLVLNPKEHFLRKTSTENSYKCEICGMIFSNAHDYLKTHYNMLNFEELDIDENFLNC